MPSARYRADPLIAVRPTKRGPVDIFLEKRFDCSVNMDHPDWPEGDGRESHPAVASMHICPGYWIPRPEPPQQCDLCPPGSDRSGAASLELCPPFQSRSD